MAHWFDDLAKKLAAGEPSRRTFVGGLAAFLFGTAASGARTPALAALLQRGGGRSPAGNAGAAVAHGQPNGRLVAMKPSNDVSLNGGPCTFTSKGKRVVGTLTSTTTANGFEIVVHETRTNGPMQSEHDVSLDVNGKGQYSVIRRKPSPGKALAAPALVITAGPAFGFQNLRLTSQDGLTLQGKINGRAITPINVEQGSKLTGIQFADGKPAPSITENAQLREAIQQAFVKASQEAKLCFPSEPMAEGHRRNEVNGEPGAIYESAANAQYSKACMACYNNCYSQYNDCAKQGAEDCAGPWWFLCLPAYMATTCGPNQDTCTHKCAYSATCCPVKCDNAPPSDQPGWCCPAGDKCVDPGNGYCCPDGYNTACVSGFCVCCPGAQGVCNGICCGPGQACSKEGAKVGPTANGPGICCAHVGNAPPVSCGGKCCGAGETCVSSPTQSPLCCPEKLACGGTCCEGGECRNGKCIMPPGKAAPCLTGGPGLVINGKCCPSARVCGTVCCAEGQVCADEKNGTCKKGSATATKTVARPGPGQGSAGGATISIMNAGKAMPPPVTLLNRATIRLRGAGFAPGVVVNIHLDSAKGRKIGSATPNKQGVFAENFQLTVAAVGSHEIVAVQAANERGVSTLRGQTPQTLQASVQVNLQVPPK